MGDLLMGSSKLDIILRDIDQIRQTPNQDLLREADDLGASGRRIDSLEEEGFLTAEEATNAHSKVLFEANRIKDKLLTRGTSNV